MDDPPENHAGDSPQPATSRPTLKTIAEMTGLAVATVSRALLDAPDIGAETKKRVNEVADRIGYRPNRAGVRLRTGRTNVISLVLSTDHDVMNHTARLISSIASGLRDTPYHMIVTPYFPSEDPMVPVRYIVDTKSADAIIINQTTPDDPRVAFLMRHKFPFATHGRTQWCDHHPYYDFDNRRFAEIGVEQFARRGRRHALLVPPPMNQYYALEMKQGFEAAARRAGMRASILPGATSDSPSEEIEAAVQAFILRENDVDAIIAPSTTAALSAFHQAEEMGMTIGQEVDVFAKEAFPLLKKFRKSILTVGEDVGTAGQFLAAAAIQSIAQPAKPPMQALETPHPNSPGNSDPGQKTPR